MNGSETSTPTASPSGPTRPASCWVVSPKPQPMSSTRSPGFGGWSSSPRRRALQAGSTIRSRNSTKRSKSTPLQASVASSFSAATGPALGTTPFSTGQWYGGGHACYTIVRGPLRAYPDVPVSYVTCMEDRMVSSAWGSRAARDRLGVEPAGIPGGHEPQISRPRELAELLLALG